MYNMSLKNELDGSGRSMDMVREAASKLDQKSAALWTSKSTLPLWLFASSFFLFLFFPAVSAWWIWWEIVWASTGDVSEGMCYSSVFHCPRHNRLSRRVWLPAPLPAVWHSQVRHFHCKSSTQLLQFQLYIFFLCKNINFVFQFKIQNWSSLKQKIEIFLL